MAIQDLQVLEWSKKQNAFHIHRLDYCIESNLNALVSNESRDYIPVMIGSREDCQKVAARYRERLADRERLSASKQRRRGKAAEDRLAANVTDEEFWSRYG